ncbi:Ribonuclease T2 [Cichlidogyrus casuarinus]|uniref:Ribonuclease T2 n=1 Tax=Cichlidogyrus casuarinus TaxID=1844966 RepID=A0ABD2QCN6_9PLAT
MFRYTIKVWHILALAAALFVVILLAICIPILLSNRLEWDYMVFSQEWPPSACLKRRCNMTNHNFNIHGLWPTIFPTKQISSCHGAPIFNASSLTQILPTLEVEWSDLYLPSNPNKFWRHEWMKHGTCAFEDKLIHQERDYFAIGLDLKQRFTTLNHLVSAGFSPSNSTIYQTEDVLRALAKAYGKEIHLTCHAIKGGHHYLQEVRTCVDPDLKLIDCPQPVKFTNYFAKRSEPWAPIDFPVGNCGSSISIPEFPSN